MGFDSPSPLFFDAMKNFLFFLLGFTIVFAACIAYAGSYPGECIKILYTQGAPDTGTSTLQAYTELSFDSVNGILLQSSPAYMSREGTYYLRALLYYWDADRWVKKSETINFRASPGLQLPANSQLISDIQVATINAALGTGCGPPPCNPPNYINPIGECVPCPSGVFLVTGYCVPNCDYSRPYIPGELYNPPDGTGTCVMPDCGPGQKTDAEGRCVPDCAENQKIDTVSGSCVYDCPYGTHEVDGECMNDCLPGFYKDAETGSCVEERGCLPGEDFVNGLCVNKCLPGETRAPDGSCIAAPVNCPFGQHLENGKCVASKVNCPPGSSFDPSVNTCTADPIEQEEDRLVVDNGDGTFTETRTVTTTTSDGTAVIGTSQGGSISGTITSVTTGTIPQEGYPPSGGFAAGEASTETTITPPSVDKYESPERSLNWDSWNSQKRRFAEEGPMKILKKLQGLLESFDVEPETPSFDFVIGGHHFDVNLHAFDDIAAGVRFLFGCFMTIGAVTFGYRIFGLF